MPHCRTRIGLHRPGDHPGLRLRDQPQGHRRPPFTPPHSELASRYFLMS